MNNYLKNFAISIIFTPNGIPALIFPMGTQSCTMREYDIETGCGAYRRATTSYQTRYFVEGTRCVNEYHNKYNKNLTPTRSKSLY